MIPVTLSTPDNEWEISVPVKSIQLIRALAGTSGNHSKTGQITTPDESFQNVPVSAINYLDVCYRIGVLV